jgi:integrase
MYALPLWVWCFAASSTVAAMRHSRGCIQSPHIGQVPLGWWSRLPRFKDEAPQALDLSTLQQFATDLRKTLSRKTTVNILSSVFVILDYAKRCGTLVADVSLGDLELGETTSPPEPAYFTKDQAKRIIAEAQEPYRTMFAVLWSTGLRAGELLALGVDDIDFTRRTIRVHKSADDATRVIHQTKTKKSTATLPMPSALERFLQNYLTHHWKSNPSGLLFPNRKGTRPRLRDNVVRYGLKPVLKKLGIPIADVGLHAFRHGLATELVESCVPMTVLQQQMRHANVRTTLAIYSHAIPETQRDAMEKLAELSIGTFVPIGTAKEPQTVSQ